jgi:hypothetical protein
LTVERIAQLGDDELYAIGINRLQVSEQAQEGYLDLGKKAAAQRWWVGKVFGEIKRRKNRHWSLWLNTKRLGSKRRTIDDAILLSERMTLERASELGLADAMREAGVWEERKPKEDKKPEDPGAEDQEEQRQRSARKKKGRKPRPRLHHPDVDGIEVDDAKDKAANEEDRKPMRRSLPLLPDAQVGLALIAPGHFVVAVSAGAMHHELHITRSQLEALSALWDKEMEQDDDCQPDVLPTAVCQ